MLDEFLAAIDLSKCRVIDYPRYIFLCGGPISSSNGTTPPRVSQSLRQSLLQKIARDHPDLEQNILLAETIFARFDKDHYGDLLTFERYLATFCSTIVIILESPGAIAEFGAFVLLEEAVDKLYAVIDTSHYISPSFIRKGPVEYLIQKEEKQVISHNWLVAKGTRPATPKVRILAADLIGELR